ncbi:hypothetical protein [Zoogloea sp.]|uniref:hypothetical protein n=1 Tax=Zoogloea sp. TaxID=49181 RepID=UPI00260E5751|nr:hypothetical protein [Zoogloea sp.]MDD3354378.1 hypothetical protein [Zoogloea sp.]
MTPQLEHSPGPEIPSEALILRVWQNDPENLRPLLSAQECRAVERFVSRASSDPWEVKRLLSGGLTHVYLMIWAAPVHYGIA